MVDKKLLALLRCPVTKQPLRRLTAAQLQKLNDAIATGRIKQQNGRPVNTPLEDALLTEGGRTIYKIVDDIPVMVEAESIAVQQLKTPLRPAAAVDPRPPFAGPQPPCSTSRPPL